MSFPSVRNLGVIMELVVVVTVVAVLPVVVIVATIVNMVTWLMLLLVCCGGLRVVQFQWMYQLVSVRQSTV